jgi:hypothetical protein
MTRVVSSVPMFIFGVNAGRARHTAHPGNGSIVQGSHKILDAWQVVNGVGDAHRRCQRFPDICFRFLAPRQAVAEARTYIHTNASACNLFNPATMSSTSSPEGTRNDTSLFAFSAKVIQVIHALTGRVYVHALLDATNSGGRSTRGNAQEGTQGSPEDPAKANLIIQHGWNKNETVRTTTPFVTAARTV